MKKTTGEIIILQLCTKNYDQLLHNFLNMVRDKQTDTDEQTNGQTEKATYRGGCST